MAELKEITVPVRVKLRPKLIRAFYRRVRDLKTELERTEADLGVAVHEATTARAECGKWLRAAGELAAQRQAVLDLCDQTRAGTSTFPIDCTNNCYDSDCDCSGKFRPLSWKLDPDAIRSALGVGAATGTPDAPCGCDLAADAPRNGCHCRYHGGNHWDCSPGCMSGGGCVVDARHVTTLGAATGTKGDRDE